MRKQILKSILGVAVAVLMGSCRGEQERAPQAAKFELQTISVGEFATSQSYTASVQGKQDIDIYPQVSGYLQDIKVTEGEQVSKGDLLFVIEQTPYRAAYRAAQASTEMARAAQATAELNYNNSKSLHSKGIISDVELQTVANTLQSAKAQLSVAEAQEVSAKTSLDFTEVKSPSEGVVGKLPYRQGALVSSSLPQSLTTISDNSTMYVYFSMSEVQVYNLLAKYGSLEGAVEAMSELELKLSNGTLYSSKGKLESISGKLDSSTGAVSLRASFPNAERMLLSGSTASVIVAETLTDVIVIPKAATYDLQDQSFVYRVVDGVTKSTPVTLSKSMNSTEYVVSSGLQAGDVIIASGAGLVRDGVAVKQ